MQLPVASSGEFAILTAQKSPKRPPWPSDEGVGSSSGRSPGAAAETADLNFSAGALEAASTLDVPGPPTIDG